MNISSGEKVVLNSMTVSVKKRLLYNWEIYSRKRQTGKEKQRQNERLLLTSAMAIDSGLGGRSALWVSGTCGLGEDRERM